MSILTTASKFLLCGRICFLAGKTTKACDVDCIVQRLTVADPEARFKQTGTITVVRVLTNVIVVLMVGFTCDISFGGRGR